ncbi:MAG: prepilin-type N-terminal cleavage/methylation domain-containing protein [Candidatus Woykebacteria bacterium]
MKTFKKGLRNDKGFTLIEILIYFTLLSIILVIGLDLLFRISESNLESTARNRLETEGSYLLKRLTYDIRRAQEVRDPAAPGNTSSILWLRINGGDYRYTLSGSTINLQTSGPSVPITGDFIQANNLQFTNIGNQGGFPTVILTFTLSSTEPTKTSLQSKNFSTVISLRERP